MEKLPVAHRPEIAVRRQFLLSRHPSLPQNCGHLWVYRMATVWDDDIHFVISSVCVAAAAN